MFCLECVNFGILFKDHASENKIFTAELILSITTTTVHIVICVKVALLIHTQDSIRNNNRLCEEKCLMCTSFCCELTTSGGRSAPDLQRSLATTFV